jgi:hypothetical protein
MTAIVVAEHDVPSRQPRGGEQQLPRHVRQGLLLLRSDVHELARGAARGAVAAEHVGRPLPVEGLLQFDQPLAKLAGGKSFLGHAFLLVDCTVRDRHIMLPRSARA